MNSSETSSEEVVQTDRRQRRAWTEQEDAILRAAILRGHTESRPHLWHEISQHVPGRSNKDCRKRWYGQMERQLRRGAWTPEEDQLLREAVEMYTNQWSQVAAIVGSRSGDQCAKRWTDAINPEIGNADHSRWKPEEDALLAKGVKKHGRAWAQIVRLYLPRRTGLAAKNRLGFHGTSTF
ncbi:hypothetical protein CALVIDRAFT_521914 [Calocera viscosa TUFC12733]|uniref:Homeodomain-like protein n=1 Tax=Calocera viscosa (strain TUFC12733) TaxID=1330018 RepID=A0A167H338_CALVF|nr:hypothetical protein CALVIDRAFT_521914 [Calocera viscosa TUFC12733]